jgi:hypothetical protein
MLIMKGKISSCFTLLQRNSSPKYNSEELTNALVNTSLKMGFTKHVTINIMKVGVHKTMLISQTFQNKLGSMRIRQANLN